MRKDEMDDFDGLVPEPEDDFEDELVDYDPDFPDDDDVDGDVDEYRWQDVEDMNSLNENDPFESEEDEIDDALEEFDDV